MGKVTRELIDKGKQLRYIAQKTYEKNGKPNYDIIYNCFQLALGINAELGDLEYSIRLAKYVKEILMLPRQDDEKLDDLLMQVFKYLARYDLDSYLIYLEKDREPEERFYLPKRRQFLKLGLIQSLQELEDDKLDILSISMPPGTQKCQKLTNLILTPYGFKTFGEIKPGDKVISGTGNISTILSESPIKKRPMYEVRFDDGSKTECSDNHIWHVQTREDRRTGRRGYEKYRDIELKDMIKNYKVEGGKRCNYSVDYVPRIEFEKKCFVLHPYVVGAFIGDGSLTSGNCDLTTADNEIFELVMKFLPENACEWKDKRDYTKRLKNVCSSTYNIRDKFRELGLYGKRSFEKFIPREYLYGSYEQRLWLLRGLLDTDGCGRGYYVEYSTTSEQLSKDVIELVHSLGGYAKVHKKKAGYKKDGKYIRCKDSYNIIIQFYKEMDSIFCVKRKQENFKPNREKRIWKRFITDIKYIGEYDCKCIYIDDPSHLYITDDYIITHNTTLEKFFATWVAGRHPNEYSLFFTHSNELEKVFYEGVLDIITNSVEYKWKEIFPEVKLESKSAEYHKINLGKYKPFQTIQCTSIDSRNAGKVRCNRYLFCDDLISSISEAMNSDTLDKMWLKYTVDARQRKLDGCKELHIATRWSTKDVIGRLQDAYEGNDRCRFIAVPDIDPVTGKSNFDYDYNGFTVEFFHDQALTMEDIAYRCLYKNEPIEREGLLYHEDELQTYMTLPEGEPDAVIGICDTKDKGKDYMFMPCCLQYGEKYYLVDCICDDNTDYEVQYNRLSNLIVQYHMQMVEFEHNNGGGRVAYNVEQIVKQKGWFCSISSKMTEGNKETKIIVNAPWVKNHIIFRDKSLYTRNDDYGRMMHWLLRYNTAGKNAHDDVPDGLACLALFASGGMLAKCTAMKRPW